MEVLEIGEKKYLKASQAAKKAGYTSDYVGQLCRSGEIDAHLVGRSWYVDVDQLTAHRTEKKRQSRLKAREQVKKAIADQQTVSAERPRFLRHLKVNVHGKPATYASDDRELIPLVHKHPPKVTDTYTELPVTVNKPQTHTQKQIRRRKKTQTDDQTIVRTVPRRRRTPKVSTERTDIHAVVVEDNGKGSLLSGVILSGFSTFILLVLAIGALSLQQILIVPNTGKQTCATTLDVSYVLDVTSVTDIMKDVSEITMSYLGISELNRRPALQHAA